MPSRRKRKIKSIESRRRQIQKHTRLIEEHKNDRRKQHTLGYWEKEVERFRQQIYDDTRILKRKRKKKS